MNAHNLPQNFVFAPDRECNKDDPHPLLQFTNLKDKQVITDPNLDIEGVADATSGFKHWSLDFLTSGQLDAWTPLADSDQPVKGGTLYNFDLTGMENGMLSLRLHVDGKNGAYAEKIIRLNIQLPEPPTEIPPTPTPVIPTDTPTPSPTPTEILPSTRALPTDTGTPPVPTP